MHLPRKARAVLEAEGAALRKNRPCPEEFLSGRCGGRGSEGSELSRRWALEEFAGKKPFSSETDDIFSVFLSGAKEGRCV